MLKYTEFGLSHLEVPGEVCLCIYISGCQYKCKNCHYPELQYQDYGEILQSNFDDIVNLYRSQVSCVCFMGEGEDNNETRNEFHNFVNKLKQWNLKSCLYSGRNCDIESWMYLFDYVKTGSYQEENGSLFDRTTNQRLYMKKDGRFFNITSRFWR